MTIFLLLTPSGNIVARTSMAELFGDEADYKKVAQFSIRGDQSRLSPDDPVLQALICDVFVEGALWASGNPKDTIKRWESILAANKND